MEQKNSLEQKKDNQVENKTLVRFLEIFKVDSNNIQEKSWRLFTLSQEEFDTYWEMYFLDQKTLNTKEKEIHREIIKNIHIESDDGYSMNGLVEIIEKADFSNGDNFFLVRNFIDELVSKIDDLHEIYYHQIKDIDLKSEQAIEIEKKWESHFAGSQKSIVDLIIKKIYQKIITYLLLI